MARLYAFLIVSMMSAYTYGQEPYKAMVWDIYLEQQPRNLSDEVVDAFRSEAGVVIIGAVAATYGIPPEVIGALSYAARNVEQQGEESRVRIDFENGYRFCSSQYEATSEIGRGVFNITADDTGLSIYSWLQRGRAGQGRTIIEGKLTVIAQRPSIPGRSGNVECMSTPTMIVNRNWSTR